MTKLKTEWVTYAEEEDKQVYTKQFEGSSVFSVFYRFKVPANMFYPLSMMNEIDLMKEWIPGVILSEP